MRETTAHSITWTRAKLERFKATAERNRDKDEFTFDGHPFVTGYAKYLIEYLESRL